jgi:hypothetical protein
MLLRRSGIKLPLLFKQDSGSATHHAARAAAHRARRAASRPGNADVADVVEAHRRAPARAAAQAACYPTHLATPIRVRTASSMAFIWLISLRVTFSE